MYTHQNFLDFCKSLNLDPENPIAYPEWCYWNSHQDEYPLDEEPDYAWLADVMMGR